MARLVLALCGAVLLLGCRLGDAPSFFAEDNPVPQAVDAIKARIGGPLRALGVVIAPDEITLRIQDPRDRRHVDEWRLDHVNTGLVSWDRLSGPQPFRLDLVNPDLEANLFDLDEVDFSALGRLIPAAFERAGLEDAAHIARMEIARQVVILPAPSSGAVRWTVSVRSERETAEIVADAHGTIIGADLANTRRAQSLNIFQHTELAADAARAFRAAVGAAPRLKQVNIGTQTISFTVVDPERPKATAGYVWNLGGLRRSLDGVNADGMMGTQSFVPFSVDDVDWTVLPKVVAQARPALDMPEGAVTDIVLEKPTDRPGSPTLLWKVEVTDPKTQKNFLFNSDKGTIFADTSGAVKQVLPPESRRKPSDWFDPATVEQALRRIDQEFAGGKFGVISFSNRDVTITAEDSNAPGGVAQVFLSAEGFRRFGTAGIWGSMKPFFAMADLKAITAQKIAELETETLTRLKMPPKTLSRITISHHNTDLSPRGNVTIEIRAETPGGSGGWVVYELDGTIVRVMMP